MCVLVQAHRPPEVPDVPARQLETIPQQTPESLLAPVCPLLFCYHPRCSSKSWWAPETSPQLTWKSTSYGKQKRPCRPQQPPSGGRVGEGTCSSRWQRPGSWRQRGGLGPQEAVGGGALQSRPDVYLGLQISAP